jgi:c-di-GMP-binding flagellar brake protein YcgR
VLANCYDNRKISDRRSDPERRVQPDANYKCAERRITNRRRKIENRAHIRYTVKDHIYVSLRSDFDEAVGQLIDISKGGLSVQYLATNEKSGAYSELGIFSSVDLAMERIPFRTVSDTEMDSELKSGITKLKRYGLQFENLTPGQKTKLDCFIRNHTVGNA